jgi:hypothetical protein
MSEEKLTKGVKMFKFQLGEIIKEKVTGFTGVIICRAEYATGCIQYGVQSRKLDKEGGIPNWHWIDQIRLQSTGKSLKIVKDDSGPAQAPPQTD